MGKMISFLSGACFAFGLHIVYQDAFGLERYLHVVRSHWVEGSPLLGYTIVVLSVIAAWKADVWLDKWLAQSDAMKRDL